MKRLLFLIILSYLGGCYTTKLEQKANISAINQQILNGEEISFITHNETEFELIVDKIDSMQIKGHGKIKERESSIWKNFDGAVPIDSIHLLLFSKTDYAKSLLINAAVLTLALKAIEANEGPSTPTIDVEFPSSGSSCPFIYSWQGSGFSLEGEAFGTALGKAREITTCSVLNKLIPLNNELKVQITNERPETHFINNVSMYFTEVDSLQSVIADNNQELWPVNTLQKPITAIDKTGKNILSLINKCDNSYWKNALTKSELYSDYTNSIELTFENPNQNSKVSLIVKAINTYFANFVFDKVFEFLGDRALPFLQDIENDSEVIKLIEQWAFESSLKAEIWDGNTWKQCGMIYPEANVSPFSRLIRLDISGIQENLIKIRLNSLADVWEIDEVGIDWTTTKKLKTIKVPIKSFKGPYTENKVEQILKKDELYAVLLPGQKIELTFNQPEISNGKKVAYSILVGGYLYEWFPNETTNNLFANFGDKISNNKIDYLKVLLRHKNLLLPPLYNEWFAIKLSDY